MEPAGEWLTESSNGAGESKTDESKVSSWVLLDGAGENGLGGDGFGLLPLATSLSGSVLSTVALRSSSVCLGGSG